jgi:hypothetical protein
VTEHYMPVTLNRYRVMFDDGTIHDFIDIGDNSNQRGAWRLELGYTDKKGPAILAVAHLGPERQVTFNPQAPQLWEGDDLTDLGYLNVKNPGAYL